jgi:hypothetical protein
MPNYRISKETHERLKRWAVPLTDSRDDVVRRVLDVAEGKAVEAESLHYHARSRLAVAIEGFWAGEDPHIQELPEADARAVMASRLAEHIMSTWLEDHQGGTGNADSPDAG